MEHVGKLIHTRQAFASEHSGRAGRAKDHHTGHHVANAANIRNKNTRAAYAAAVSGSVTGATSSTSRFHQLQPFLVAGYIEELGREIAAPSVKLERFLDESNA